MRTAFHIALIAVGVLCVAPRVGIAQENTVLLVGYRSPVRMDSIGRPVDVAAPAGRVFTSVVKAFDKLKIPIELQDSSTGRIGNLRMQVMRVLGGAMLSRSVDCGTDTRGGPKADVFRVYMAILVWVKPMGDSRSTLHVSVAAGAQPQSGTVSDQVSCTSAGGLEEKILKFVNEETGNRE
jgi:hypothetical protein